MKLPRLRPAELIGLVIILGFSFWLMFHTFSVKDGALVIATKAWSDFANYIPLIRSFSLGDNWPVSYPLFAGEPMRYHFLFYMLAGLLERWGLTIDWALNLLSGLSFALLIVVIYCLASVLFASRKVGLLSVVFFLFNGSLSFVQFLQDHPLSTNILYELINSSSFASFAPYQPGLVSAFWNLNIYTNQRHLALAFAWVLLVVLLVVYQEKKSRPLPYWQALGLAIGVGVLILLNSAVFLMAIIVLGMLLLLVPRQRKPLLVVIALGLMMAFPQLTTITNQGFAPHWRFGYLVEQPITFWRFVVYWFFNLGLLTILAPIGWLTASALAKKILAAFFVLFVFANSVQFSPEIAANHKFLNLLVIVANMFAAWCLLQIWRKGMVGRVVAVPMVGLLILGGIVDFFPIKNDSFVMVNDRAKNPDIRWVTDNTPKRAVFVTSSYLYHPASLAGRPVFLGWPYFPWSLGYDTNSRDKLVRQMLSPADRVSFCSIVQNHGIGYVALGTSNDFPVDYDFFNQQAAPVYANQATDFLLYQTKDLCDIS